MWREKEDNVYKFYVCSGRFVVAFADVASDAVNQVRLRSDRSFRRHLPVCS